MGTELLFRAMAIDLKEHSGLPWHITVQVCGPLAFQCGLSSDVAAVQHTDLVEKQLRGLPVQNLTPAAFLSPLKLFLCL